MSEHKNRWNEVRNSIGDEQFVFGPYYSSGIKKDLKHFMMILSRYKFISKLLKYKENISVLELGCSEGIGAIMMEQNLMLERYVGVDLDEAAVECAQAMKLAKSDFFVGDFLENPIPVDKRFDAVISVDVIEHIDKSLEKKYVESIVGCMKKGGGDNYWNAEYQYDAVC